MKLSVQNYIFDITPGSNSNEVYAVINSTNIEIILIKPDGKYYSKTKQDTVINDIWIEALGKYKIKIRKEKLEKLLK